MSGDDLLNAVQMLIGLDQRDRAKQAADHIPDDLPVADLLRAADGAQELARAVAALRRANEVEAESAHEHDPHDVRSLYS